MRIEGPALENMRAAIGLVGVGAQITEFPDGVADQVLAANDFIRRGRTLSTSEGLFTFFLQNTHTGANETISTELDPYSAGASLVGAGYPANVPPWFDIWIMSLFAETTSTAGNFDSAFFAVKHPQESRGLFSPAALPLAAMNQILFFSETENVPGGGSLIPGILTEIGSGLASKLLGVRVPRGAHILWRTRTAAVASAPVFTATGILGLFPAAMGQDGIA